MQHMTSSQAKQNFGELLDAAAHEPVAIERHRKVKAIVCSPEAFQAQVGQDRRLAERRSARAEQALTEKDRLIKHQSLAIQLLLMPDADRQVLIERARREVERWRRERLCSLDYIERWEALLKRSVNELAQSMGSETLEWGTALRQNSPWHVVMV